MPSYMMYDGYYGAVRIDWTYILLIAAFVLSMIASIKVKTTYAKYAKVKARSGMTAEEAAQRVLRSNGVYDVKIGRTGGHLTDNFNPKTKTISLSESVYGSNSIAAIGVACHEAGHAVQYDKQYAPAKLRMAMVPVTNFGARFAFIVLLLGFVLGFMGLIWVGIGLFSLTTAFQLVTLPTEFDASRRAISSLNEYGVLAADELKGAKKVLGAAAMTYVAALAVNLLTLLRYINFTRRND